jgi:hypothetical protein
MEAAISGGMMRKFCNSLIAIISGLGLVTAVATIPMAAEYNQHEDLAALTGGGLGYGFNVAMWDVSLLDSIGFNWMKVFNPPGGPVGPHILLRIEANAGHMGNVVGFGDNIASIAINHGAYIDAYEIGNEPNLDAGYGWNAPPIAADYAVLLCEAYGRIKAHHPQAKVISAGLAPTGRVQGNWNGHAGHNGMYQDERDWFKEFLDAGGGGCLDGVGYHNYGFSADYDTPPDTNGGTPETNCSNGFCFRGVEKLREIMVERGLAHKTIWTTEFGWIVNPPSHCLNDLGWQGRQWQIVSEQKQAENLAGAYQYAAAHWPWMEAMFIFNLNFNTSGWYDECEQMRFYGVQGRPAEAALREMPKEIIPDKGELDIRPLAVTAVITPGQQPFTQATQLTFSNIGTALLTYTITIDNGTLAPTLLSPPTGVVEPGTFHLLALQMTSHDRPVGTYTAMLHVTVNDVANGAADIPVRLHIFDTIHTTYLPLLQKGGG